MVKVKVCGITNLEDALASFISGADAVGFVFYRKSPRRISPEDAAKISLILPKNIMRAGVFVDEKAGKVKKIAASCGLDILQFHGNETPAYCRKFKGFKVVKAFRLGTPEDLKGVNRYKAWGYLFDASCGASFGGSGKKFNWKILAQAGKINAVVFVSGGLNPGNVSGAIKTLRPDWVDASSSLEYFPGRKDLRKVASFIKAAKRGFRA
ncbi:MAG: phosphoribosylanthranilate isomerase [Candidatus Omnitrophica bacterium]|nr:phosphoribosylanthranilate isomerase [Candidatus Omnitrophota bacterium]